mmetsp:Transcript_29950/g.56496  ORF Transcript_29950/g.56496 Transcript_29950/m.56496 type:complete len:367 (+) Transcript_29950:167-1267(+)
MGSVQPVLCAANGAQPRSPHGTRAGEEQPPQVGLASHDLGEGVGVGDVVHKGFDPLAVLTQQVQPESAIRSGQLVHVLRTGQFHLAATNHGEQASLHLGQRWNRAEARTGVAHPRHSPLHVRMKHVLVQAARVHASPARRPHGVQPLAHACLQVRQRRAVAYVCDDVVALHLRTVCKHHGARAHAQDVRLHLQAVLVQSPGQALALGAVLADDFDARALVQVRNLAPPPGELPDAHPHAHLLVAHVGQPALHLGAEGVTQAARVQVRHRAQQLAGDDEPRVGANGDPRLAGDARDHVRDIRARLPRPNQHHLLPHKRFVGLVLARVRHRAFERFQTLPVGGRFHLVAAGADGDAVHLVRDQISLSG